MSEALIATVGGTPQPIIRTLIEHRPKYVCFLCSQDSIEMVAEIKSGVKAALGLDEAPFQDFKVIVDDINDLVGCYQRAQECVRRIRQWEVRPEETVVDYTGGTKTMSVALGLATIANGYLFSYVGGRERTKGGLGVVMDGAEEIRTGVSPWTLFAIEERQRIAQFFNRYQFIAALESTRELLRRRDLDERWRKYFEIVEQLCLGYSSWDLFQHKLAGRYLKRAADMLESFAIISGRKEYDELLEAVRRNAAWIEELRQGEGGMRLVGDLLANAERRAQEGKYDDAVARLYRALELRGQIALREPPLEIESASSVPIEKVPERLREEFARRYGDAEAGRLKIGLAAVYTLLAESGHPLGAAYFANEKELSRILHARNQSILAHGLIPLSEEHYKRLSEVMRSQMGITDTVAFARMPVE